MSQKGFTSIIVIFLGVLVILVGGIYYLIQSPSVPQAGDCNKKWFSLEEGLRAPQYVCSLNLTSYKDTVLTSDITKFTNLTDLDISDSPLTILPPQIGSLKNLRSLVITGTRLTSLPPEIGQLSNLEELYLDNNQITSLPPEVYNLKNLSMLDMRGNPLTQQSIHDLTTHFPFAVLTH